MRRTSFWPRRGRFIRVGEGNSSRIRNEQREENSMVGVFQPRGRTARHAGRREDWAAPVRASRNLSVAVLGAGHGGLALAGFLARAGHRVALWNRSEERIDPIEATGGIRLTTPGATPTVEPIALATTTMGRGLG